MSNKRITKLNTAKNRLGSAVKRFRQATDLLDEFFKEVLPDPEKPDWNTMSPEHHLLYDCQRSIHDMRQQTLRLLCQILHVKRIECRNLCPENEQKEEPEMERNWQVIDESHERPGYICLAIREEESGRLIADMSDYPNDVPGFVDRVKEEARLIAHAKELRQTLERMVYAAESKEESKYEDGALYRETLKESYALLDKLKND